MVFQLHRKCLVRATQFVLMVLVMITVSIGQTAKRPNIVLIVADDLGFSDLGLMGSEIKTPNLDKLAANGVLMTQFYNAGRCCPSRASLLTGLYAHKAGVGDMTQNRGLPAYQGYLNENSVTIAEALKESGYTTAMAGKWHVGEEPAYWPQRRGFENFYGIPQGGGVYFYPFLVKRELWHNDQVIVPSPDFYSTDAFNDYAADFIKTQKDADKPFFLYLAHIAPHFPLQAKEEDIRQYRGKYQNGFKSVNEKRWEKQQLLNLFSDNIQPAKPDEAVDDWSSLSPAKRDTADHKMAIYAAQVASMDRGIGRVIEALRSTGQLDNTIILFFSDNGGEADKAYPVPGATGPLGSAKSWASYGPSWAYVSNTPFKKYKKYTYEGGIRTPLIVHYPALIKTGRIESKKIGHVIDIMPTILELAKAAYPRKYKGRDIAAMAGQSLMPVLELTPSNSRILFWEHEGNRAARDGDWKLVSTYPENKWRLYNLKEDPTELEDLSNLEKAKCKHLVNLYEEWAIKNGVQPWESVLALKKKGK